MSRISHVLGAAPNTSLARASSFTQEILPMAAGAVIGSYAWKRHPWLGAFFGMAVGEAAYPLAFGDGTDRADALCKVGAAGLGAYAGAKVKWRGHPNLGAALGYVGGALAGSALTSLVPGTSIHEHLKRSA